MSSDIVDLIKQIGLEAVSEGDPVNIMFGEVTSVSPLEITVEQRLKIREEHIILTKNVTDYSTYMTFDNAGIRQIVTSSDITKDVQSDPYYLRFKDRVKHEITIYNALGVSDQVVLLRVQGGQKFIALERLVD